MNPKEFVQSVYPNAKAEKFKEYDSKKSYWLIFDENNLYFAKGDTELLAWKEAKEFLEKK